MSECYIRTLDYDNGKLVTVTTWHPRLASSSAPQYVALVDALARDVASGALRPGERLPTHRQLARALGLSVGTVTRAYGEAERRGLMQGQVGRGSFVADPAAGSPLAASEPAPAAVDLAVTWPLYGLDPELAPALRELAADPGAQALLRYPPHAGLARHREAGAAWARRHGVAADPSRVLVCAGIQHAWTVTLASIAQPGDVLLTEELTYPGLIALARLLRLRLVGVAMDGDGIDPDAVAAICRRRRVRALYTVPVLQNPTTAVLPLERRRALARLAAQHGFALLEDDVHRLLHPDPEPPIAALDPERVFHASGLSKTFAGGIRVSFLTVPAGTEARLAEAVWATTWMTSPLNAELVARWIADGTADQVAARKRAEAGRRQALARELLPAARSAGWGYHLWLPLAAPWTSASLVEAARREGVLVTPADAFAVGRAAPRAVRVTVSAAADLAELRRGLLVLAELSGSPPRPPSGLL
jgi:DNA-binding transcriptional MocR family regulator